MNYWTLRWCNFCFQTGCVVLCGPLKGLKPKVNWIVRSWFPRETVRTVPAEADQTKVADTEGGGMTRRRCEFIPQHVAEWK